MTLTEIDSDDILRIKQYEISAGGLSAGTMVIKDSQEVVFFHLDQPWHNRQGRRDVLEVTRQLVGSLAANCPLYQIAAGSVL